MDFGLKATLSRASDRADFDRFLRAGLMHVGVSDARVVEAVINRMQPQVERIRGVHLRDEASPPSAGVVSAFTQLLEREKELLVLLAISYAETEILKRDLGEEF